MWPIAKRSIRGWKRADIVIDTNILVYAADDAAPEQEPCRVLLERCRADTLPWYLTWGIAYEFLRVVTHPRVLRQPRSVTEAWGFLTSLLASPTCAVLVATSRHAEVAEQFFADHKGVLKGNLLHDAHTAVLMREHGVGRIATRDADFHRFSSIAVIDPMAGE